MNISKACEIAVADRKIIKILYKGRTNRVQERFTEPYGIENGYYIAWCLKRKNVLKFNISNIVDATVTESTFSPRDISTYKTEYA